MPTGWVGEAQTVTDENIQGGTSWRDARSFMIGRFVIEVVDQIQRRP